MMRGPQAMTQTTRRTRHAGAQPLGLCSHTHTAGAVERGLLLEMRSCSKRGQWRLPHAAHYRVPPSSREVLEPDPLDVRPEPAVPPAADGDVGFDFHRLAGVVPCIIGIVLLHSISLRLMALRLNRGLMALRLTATRQRPVEGGA